MKRILGLDLGTNSIGWALVNEKENENEKSSIVKLGVRVNPLTVDEQQNFEKGKSITTNSDRTLKRGMRRNLQRYKLRRENLIEVLKENNIITDDSILYENGNRTTFETLRLRAKSVIEEISLSEFARVLLMINKKRGYKSSRKAKSTEEGQLIDGMEVAKQLYDNNWTPGQFVLQLLNQGKKYIPDFYRSDLQEEFDRIWGFQKQFYSEILTDELKGKLQGKNEKQTWAICHEPFGIVGIKRETKGEEQKKENYLWRVNALTQKIDLEQLAIVLSKVNVNINASSGYLGDISDRSKELFFNKQTVGQFLVSKLNEDPHYSLKNKVFYRQDYLDEFEVIWEKQAQYHKELTPELKKEIRDIVIFYQRPLKSQKGLISICELEGKMVEVEVDGKRKNKLIGPRVCPKSSPIFQEFKIWQILNNIQVSGKVIPNEHTDLFGTETEYIQGKRFLEQFEKEMIFEELNVKEKLSKAEALKLLFKNASELDLNYNTIEGNTTNATLFSVYQTIIDMFGHGEYDFAKMPAKKSTEIVESVFSGLGYNTGILHFNAELKGTEFEQQPAYQLWHLIYSAEDDNSKMGNENLVNKISDLFGFDKVYAKILATVVFQPDYGSLSAKAIRKILPHLKDGHDYSLACAYAGYKHSKKSLTKEELENKVLKDNLELLPKNSLRNPVVEKILNQMINVVNSVIETYGKPDEIRIELARELKKSAQERTELVEAINKSTAEHEKYREILQKEFGIQNVSRNDIIRYKLYLELESNGFKTLYSNTYIPQEKLFSKEFDIEHIIPQAKLFDDSFSNKTLEARAINIEKGNLTAYDYILGKYGEKYLEEYKNKIEKLYADKVLSKTKYQKLLTEEKDIPSGFIERDLRDTQYIAKKAREILEEIVKFVVPTTGIVTDRLREDWQLVDVMKELNWDKYNKLEMTEVYEDKDGRKIGRIKGWTKRNDHRHHAMDALTIAFTKHSYIQYLNNLNARVQKGVDDYIDLDMVELKELDKKDRSSVIYAIEKKELKRDEHGKLKFIPPMQDFRSEAKKHLENILVSIKAKNKVVTRNVNKAKNKVVTEIVSKDGDLKSIKGQLVLTPRGQLHNETVYGKIKQYATKEEKVGGNFDYDKIMLIAVKRYRLALLKRLEEFNNDPKKAFTGKNSLDKNPVWIDEMHTEQVPLKVKLVSFEDQYTIRKPIAPDLKIEKVIDAGIRKILEERLKEYGGDAKKAFSNLDENPIYLNKENGITIKRVKIRGVSNATALHDKHDHLGNLILDENGKTQPTDFVSTSNNHHVAIYRKPSLDKNGQIRSDEDGNVIYELEENVVSFFEATSRVNMGLPIIDKEYKKDEGWQFLFTMKQNEYFVFPRYETVLDENGNAQQIKTFDPKDIDLMNPDNYALISKNLYRVQKFAYKNYVFRHHLESTIDLSDYSLRGTTWVDFRSSKGLDEIVKVRVNHIGQIVYVGEY